MRLESLWYGSHPLSFLLAPLGWLYALIASLRRLAYRSGVLRRDRMPVPVIVVGNVTVGGTGKTPLVIWLVEHLQRSGHRPGVVSRGYGGKAKAWPQLVNADSDPYLMGDEPVLIAQRTACPVAVGPRRAEAAGKLLAEFDCDVIVCDDGLQHYALKRDLEIAVIDGERRLGNGRCLPAGPLRELPVRLHSVDMVIVNGVGNNGEYTMTLTGDRAVQVRDKTNGRPLAHWRDQTVHGVAGIGNPGRFFRFLGDHGLRVMEHPFPDHHDFTAEELHFTDGLPVMMTEKDAVKCRGVIGDDCWCVPVAARLGGDTERALQQKVHQLFAARDLK